MPQLRPNNKPLLKEDIIVAIGKSKQISDGKKEAFAKNLIKDLENVFLADSTAYPDKEIVNQFNKDLEQLLQHIQEAKRLSGKIEKYSKKSSFVKALLAACSRAVKKKNYNSDIDDVVAFLEVSADSVKNLRFQNKKQGPDNRLSLEVALIIARHYKKFFNEIPGVSGMGKRDDGTDNNSPFQRICKVVSNTKNIKGLGKRTQETAIQLVADNQPSPWPFFKPDIKNLPGKGTN